MWALHGTNNLELCYNVTVYINCFASPVSDISPSVHADYIEQWSCRRCRVLHSTWASWRLEQKLLWSTTEEGVAQWRSDNFRAPRKQLVWAPGQGVTATTSSWRAPVSPFSPAAPRRSRGLRGPRYATGVAKVEPGIYGEGMTM